MKTVIAGAAVRGGLLTTGLYLPRLVVSARPFRNLAVVVGMSVMVAGAGSACSADVTEPVETRNPTTPASSATNPPPSNSPTPTQKEMNPGGPNSFSPSVKAPTPYSPRPCLPFCD